MGSFSWVHLVLAVLIIIFTILGATYSWLVVIFAAIIAVLSIFGVSSGKSGYYSKKEVRPVMKAQVKKKK